MKTLIISIFYFLSGLLYIFLGDHIPFVYRVVLKALIIPILMILLLVNLGRNMNRSNRLIFAGLIFSWAGDMILEFSQINNNMFIYGLVCFLLAHVMYCIVFFMTPGRSVVLNKRVYLLIPVLLYGAGLLYYLYYDLAELRIPVIIYAIVILTMLSGAIDRIEKVNRSSFYIVLSGASLFIISDSAIAINKFSHQFEYSTIVIMTTYVIAQYLIVSGYINQILKNSR